MRVAHVVPLLNHSAPTSLQEAQRLAIASQRNAIAHSEEDLEVSLYGAGFADEDVIVESVIVRPTLRHTARDFVPHGIDRRLPLLAEVLDALPSPQNFDIFVYTNADIAVQPQFYRAVAELVNSGIDAGSITRRTVPSPPTQVNPLVWASMQEGDRHAGHDCLFFAAHLLTGVDVGRVTLGAGNVMRPLLASLFMRAERFEVFTHLHLTFHIDDEQDWKQDSYTPNYLFNSQETVDALLRLESVYGRTSLESFMVQVGFDPHPGVAMPDDFRAILESSQKMRRSTETFGSRINRATQPWPRVNRIVHGVASTISRS